MCLYSCFNQKNEQATSLETQKLYYQEFIESHEDWEFCGIYSDATTGTKLTRPGFSAMLRRCGIVIDDSKSKFEIKLLTMPSEYDLIVIKNTSRFARSADAPSLVEKLRLKNVFVYFETLGKSTEVIDNDLLINIMFQIDKNYSSALSKIARLSYIRAIELRGTKQQTSDQNEQR